MQHHRVTLYLDQSQLCAVRDIDWHFFLTKVVYQILKLLTDIKPTELPNKYPKIEIIILVEELH